YTYGISERQLSNYAEAAFAEADPSGSLHRALEMRADSVVYRAGFAPTRRAARQIVSHGHIVVNGKRITVPSYHIRKGDASAIREGSRSSPLFAGLAEDKAENSRVTPKWLDVDLNLLTATLVGEPAYNPLETGLEYAVVFEFYSR